LAAPLRRGVEGKSDLVPGVVEEGIGRVVERDRQQAVGKAMGKEAVGVLG
jgi:uncharacterized protein YjbJ (UPF0337 family)